MKVAFRTCLCGLAALSMTGCPIYPADDHCSSDWDCAPNYYCDVNRTCLAIAESTDCNAPQDCTGANEVCGRHGTCVVGSCHVASVGCVAGFTCTASDSTPDRAWTCMPIGAARGTGGSSASTDAGLADSG